MFFTNYTIYAAAEMSNKMRNQSQYICPILHLLFTPPLYTSSHFEERIRFQVFFSCLHFYYLIKKNEILFLSTIKHTYLIYINS